MDINNLTEAEKVSLAKADAGGVIVEARDRDNQLIPNEETPAAAAPKVKPAGLPDKFWNATTGEADYAGLAKSYTELEKARGAKPVVPAVVPAAAAVVTPEAKAAADAAAALAAAKAADPAAVAAAAAAAATPEAIAAKAAAKAAADAAALAVKPPTSQEVIDASNAEWQKEGKLSDKTYEALAATGVNRQMVDMYIAGQLATRDAAVAKVTADIGGPEAYATLSVWAKASLTSAELAEYNANVAGTPNIAKLAVNALHARYVAESGTDGKIITGGNGKGSDSQGYANQTEMMAAINDPRYKRDSAYRAAVEAKIGRTSDDIV